MMRLFYGSVYSAQRFIDRNVYPNGGKPLGHPRGLLNIPLALATALAFMLVGSIFGQTSKKVHISAGSMEDISGISGSDQPSPGASECERSRKRLAEATNAVIREVSAAGATETIVNNSHGGINGGSVGKGRINALLAPFKPAAAQSQQTGKIVREGIVVEFAIAPLKPEKGGVAGLLEGTEASVRFKIADSNTGLPVTNLRPAGWIDFREEAAVPDARQCRERIQSFLQASLTDRPDIDLNAYLILALNQEPNISVIDPISSFGGSKLYTLIQLSSSGEDWLMSGDKQRLFVTMPLAGQIAIIDTATWKVLTNLDAGARPTRIVLQNDEKYLWVGNDMEGEGGGVTIVDWSTKKTVARFKTGAGHHDIVLTDDDRYAFVTNQKAGTLSVIDVPKLTIIKEIKVGSSPSALAFSSLSKTVYAINESDGTIVAVGGPRHEVLTRIKAMPGLSVIRFLPGGRYGFVLNRQSNLVHIFDSSTNRLLHNVSVGPDPDQIIFSRDVAYVRARGNEFVSLINLASIGRQEIETSVNRFPAGQKAPQASPSTSMADAMIVTPDAGAVLVANPADKMIYYYMEGMAAPMGTFQNYRRDPRALLVWSRSLRETSPGTYATTVKLGKKGNYDVPLLLNSPRIVHCFNFTVSANPDHSSQRAVPTCERKRRDGHTVDAGYVGSCSGSMQSRQPSGSAFGFDF